MEPKMAWIMKLPKIYLTVCIALFLVSLTSFGGSIGYGLLRPLAFVSFILFFLFQILGKESAKFDEDQAEQLRVCQRQGPRASRPQQSAAAVGAQMKNA